MKQKINLISIFLTISFLLSLTSCQVEEETIAGKNSNQSFKIKRISEKEIKNFPEALEKIKDIDNLKFRKTSQKIVNDTVLNILIDTNEAVLIEGENYTSLTFPVFRDNSNDFENLVVYSSNGTTETYIVNYGDNLNSTLNGQNHVASITQISFDTSTLNSKIEIRNTVTTVYSDQYGSLNYYCEESWDISTEYGYMDVANPSTGVDTEELISSSCYHMYTFNISNGGGGDVGGETSNNHGELGSGSGSGSVTTSPITSSVEYLIVKDFVRTLTPSQLNWWNNIASNDEINSISNYLSQIDADQVFATELIDMAKDEEDEELISDLINLSIVTKQNGYFDNPYDSNYYNLINPYTEVDTQTYSPLWYVYFRTECAIARYKLSQEPGWSDLYSWQQDALVYWEASKEMLHLGLDLIGLAPVVGEIADLANGIIYTIEGDGVNASLSYASAIPIAGWFSAGVKFAKRADGLVLIVKAGSNLIDFGKRSNLRKILNITNSSVQAHHIMPWAFRESDLVQKAAKSSDAFHMNQFSNGFPLPTTNHLTGHNLYNDKIQSILTDNLPDINDMTPNEAYTFLTGLNNHIKGLLQTNPTMNLGQISDLISYP